MECKTTRSMSMVVREVYLLIKMLFVFVSSLSTENLLEVDNLPHVGHLVPHSLKYNNLFPTDMFTVLYSVQCTVQLGCHKNFFFHSG